MLKELLASIKETSPAQPTLLDKEIEECLVFFGIGNIHEKKKGNVLLHSGKIEIGRKADQKKGYFLSKDILYTASPPHKEIYTIERGQIVRRRKSYMDGNFLGRTDGEMVTKKELDALVEDIHNITLPYKEHIERR